MTKVDNSQRDLETIGLEDCWGYLDTSSEVEVDLNESRESKQRSGASNDQRHRFRVVEERGVDDFKLSKATMERKEAPGEKLSNFLIYFLFFLSYLSSFLFLFPFFDFTLFTYSHSVHFTIFFPVSRAKPDNREGKKKGEKGKENGIREIEKD